MYSGNTLTFVLRLQGALSLGVRQLPPLPLITSTSELQSYTMLYISLDCI